MQLAVLLQDDLAMVFAARQETLGSLVSLHQQYLHHVATLIHC
jgi:hypothetical protein